MAERSPIIYLRGYAGPPSGVDKQTDDPFYGLNSGATHIRVGGEGTPRFYQFEGPLLRLMSDEGYQLLVRGDQHAYLQSQADGAVAPESIWVHRFYDCAASTFGTSVTAAPEEFDLERAAERLYDFVQLVRRKTGAPKVHLVAHSMGGLLARCLIQKVSRTADPRTGEPRRPGSELVDKLFTYGTPHGGIAFDFGGGLVDWAMETFGPNGSDIFAPDRMYTYLTPGASNGDDPPPDWRPNEIPAEAFDTRRVFCVVGTNAADYGLVEKAVGPRSDGLVHIDNAYVRHAHRAFVHRSHSGRYGLVNSEEGYQNLRRFLFGNYQVRADLRGLELPDQPSGASRVWQAEVRLAVRGLPTVMHEQRAAHYCPIQLNQESARHGSAEGDAGGVPLATAFLLDRGTGRGLDRGTGRGGRESRLTLRSRYTLVLRVFHLVEKNGRFFWEDHLEQVPDWEDTLIVDVGPRDLSAETGAQAWAAWNSQIPGSIDDTDPIAAEPCRMVEDGDDLHTEIPMPEIVRPLLGSTSRLRLTVSRFG
ncbi:esterase/lipase family protein [Streptomyces angustmyceticus]|uniref:esterase/lipase family protein n=1 Tax=Streptomyces angustmyceticus TaxID=285578 RepID=UPI0037F9AEA6